MTTLHDVLQREKIVLADGAMGTELQRRGMPRGMPSCLWNASRHGVVLDVHQRYVDVGARLLWTNTFGADRATLERIRESDQSIALVRAGVLLARQAAGSAGIVVGSMGPASVPWKSLDADERIAQHDAWSEQVEVLAGEGVDAIALETITALDELATMLRAVGEGIARSQRNEAVPVLASFCPKRDEPRALTLLSGEPLGEAAEAMANGDAMAIGVNCGVNLQDGDWAECLDLFHEKNTRATLLLKPNAGTPVDDQWPLAPEPFARMVARAVHDRRAITGGCCGTTPAHIEALRRALEGR